MQSAIRRIAGLPGVSVKKVSSFTASRPVGGPPGQPAYLNGALRIHTRLTPRELLRSLKDIEKDLGRKKAKRNSPRVIDIDILLYDAEVMRSPGLVIPHPRMFERDFVMRPLAEVL